VNRESRIPAGRLERRIRLLLRAYPPGYRADRGEEMLGTLLEATPDGRDWPPARDAWSLLAGGTRARRAGNRQLGPATSLRQVIVLGLALFLSWESAQFFLQGYLTGAHWTPVLAGLLLAAAAVGAWVGHRALMIVTVAAGLVVADWYFYWTGHGFHASLSARGMAFGLLSTLPLILAMLALVYLTRRDGRPPRSWLILACAPLLAVLVARALPFLLHLGYFLPVWPWELLPDVVLLLAVPALAWLATDARPALGVAIALVVSEAYNLATTDPLTAMVTTGVPGHEVVHVYSPPSVWQWGNADVQKLALAVVLTTAMGWLLRRRTRSRLR
jgi:hypothetical protein